MERDYKSIIIGILMSNIDKVNWVRKDTCNAQEFTSEISTYKFRICATTNEGCFIVCTPKGSSIGKSINDKEYPILKDLFRNIFDNDIRNKENNFWNLVADNIARELV